jgi:hypothetical protein
MPESRIASGDRILRTREESRRKLAETEKRDASGD